MTVTGIIAEYNPFHNGHAHQIQQVKEQLHSDYVIVVMSGDFVQRGECAIIDKYHRAQMALSSGADLVLELPVLFSTASAPYFALGGCEILDALGCVDNLCFGTESGDADAFTKIASVLTEEPDTFKEVLSRNLKRGMSYPLARSNALAELLPEAQALLASPNSILGIEYTKALLSINSKIRIHPIQRIGSGYHDTELTQLSSASAIRKEISSGNYEMLSLSQTIPGDAWPVLQREVESGNVLTTDAFSSILGLKLLQLSSPEELCHFFDLGPSLANRIWQKRFEYQNIGQFADLLKTKNETLLHIKRSLLHMILAIDDPDPSDLHPSYTRILSMKKEASCLLKAIKQEGQIPVITKLANADEVLHTFYQECPEKEAIAKKQLLQTTFASNLYQMEAARKTNRIFIHENTRQFPIL